MQVVIIASVAVGFLAVSLATGWWRVVFYPFRVRRSRMTIEALGFHVTEPANRQRVEMVTKSFAGGFNSMISCPSALAWRHFCDSIPVRYQPFAHEGAAMGFPLRQLLRFRASDFENTLVRTRPGMRYLYYVGLGFWSGMRKHSPEQVARMWSGLDPLYRYLCYDGYGFKVAFFDYLSDPACLIRLDRFDGYARKAAYQGLGRAFYFLFMDRKDLMIQQVRSLGEHAVEAAAGLGLASVFVNPDRIGVARELGGSLPDEWQDSFHLGMCFALKARAIADLDQFEADIAALDQPVREAISASIRECDRAELQIRSQQLEDGYGQWRAQVSRWLAQNIEYPMAGVRQDALTRPADRDKHRGGRKW